MEDVQMTTKNPPAWLTTRKEMERELLTLPPTMTGKAIRTLLGRLLAERSAYREVAIKLNDIGSEGNGTDNDVDEEALRRLSSREEAATAKGDL